MSTALRHHGDVDARPGLVDLAVNVRPGTPPEWLRRRLAAVDLARYPDSSAATAALAARHGRLPAEVLPTSGAAEAFTLIARALGVRRAAVVHPQFTEPERALRDAGVPVGQVILPPPFDLNPALVPAEADLVLLGNPTNPTSRLHPAALIRALLRPGRIVVVDEAFADWVPAERESLADDRDVVVVRSLTKAWGLAGLRAGYLLGPASLVERLATAQPHWAVSAPALEACVACSEPAALAEAAAAADELAAHREAFAAALGALPGVHVVPGATAPFLLLHTMRPSTWESLAEHGFAVRRGDTFPGLGPDWIRVAVRDPQVNAAFVAALEEVLT